LLVLFPELAARPALEVADRRVVVDLVPVSSSAPFAPGQSSTDKTATGRFKAALAGLTALA